MSSYSPRSAPSWAPECLPRFITPRSGRESRGGELVKVATALGKSPLPWQHDVFDRAFEVDEAGVLWYREIVIIVPRQSGKSTLIVPWGAHRAIAWTHRQAILYTAQTRKAAREKWIEDQVHLLTGSPLRRLLVPNRQGQYVPNLAHGEEHMRFVNGSRWGIDAPTETAGHGPTLDLGVIDEAFAQTDSRVEQAMSPAMITRADSQKLILSTPGRSKRRSAFLWGKVEAGRNRVQAGIDSRSLYVEYSAPDDADWLDPAVWWATMPALGFTQTEEKVAAEADSLGEAEFRRAYLAQWGDDFDGDSKIPGHLWAACADPASQIGSKLTWVVDVGPDRAWCAVSVAALREDGRVHLETVEHREGIGWLVPRLVQLLTRHGGADQLWYDHVTVGALVPELEAAGLRPRPIPTADIRSSAAALFDAVAEDRVRHLDQTELNEALRGAATRVFGDGWAWARGRSMADITPLVSATLAHFLLVKQLPLINYDPLSGIR